MGGFYYLRAEESQTAETKKKIIWYGNLSIRNHCEYLHKVFGLIISPLLEVLSQLSTISRELSETSGNYLIFSRLNLVL
jgi:hypothetical protein